jgi:hypothetical protein
MAILLVFILFNITLNFTLSKRKKIFIFLDNSLSMADEKKFPLAINLLKILKRELAKAKLFSFSETVKEISSLENVNCEGKRTNFQKVIDFSLSKKPDVILFLSDGLHNEGDLPFQKNLPFQIFAIGFGLPQIKDFAIDDVNFPNWAFTEESVKIVFRIKSNNLKGPLEVSLTLNEKPLEKKVINFLSENIVLEDSFKVIFKEEGKKFLTLKIPYFSEEIDQQNNQYFFTIEVKKRSAKILYLSNQPTFNLKFIKRILENKSDYQADFLFSFTRKIPLPKEKEYEILIFDNFDFSALSAEEKNNLKNLINKAKGILFLADKNSNFNNFSEYLPINIEKNITQKEVSFLLTEKGKEHVIFEEILEDINHLPPFWGYLKGKPKENCSTLLISEKDSSPLLAYSVYQNKIIAFFSAYPLWRWFFIPDEILQNKVNNFFLSLISFLKEGNYRVYVYLEKEFYYLDEEVKIKTTVLNEIGQPAKNLNLLLEIPQYQIKKIFSEVTDGLYQTNLFPPDTGEISFKISVFKDKEKIKEISPKIKVFTKIAEEKSPYLDTLTLKNLAEMSNGNFYLYPQIPSFSFLNQEKKKVNFKIYFQNNFYIYLLLIFLYILDIYLRKRKGLP